MNCAGMLEIWGLNLSFPSIFCLPIATALNDGFLFAWQNMKSVLQTSVVMQRTKMCGLPPLI
jgi:hypothetical protein